jgi:transposase InsO family protein
MDFIMGLPRTQSGYDSIWVIMHQLTKVAHFIHVKTTYSEPQLAELYMSKIVCLHGVSKKSVSDRGTQFTLKFWERLHETLDTQLRFSSAYHPQTDGQIERVNLILEDMLRGCALQYGRSWDKSLSYASFPITTAIKKARSWHRLRCCMVEGVRLHCFGVRLENEKFLDLTFCKKSRSKFVWLGRTCESHNRGRRATPIIGEES